MVVDHYSKAFSQLDKIDIAIAPGNRVDRGFATIKGILSFIGQPYKRWKDYEWIDSYGWLDSRNEDFGDETGKRWLANVNIPDLELFPKNYGNVATVQFQAGLELTLLHHTMIIMALLSKYKIIKRWDKCARFIILMSELFSRFGTDVGGMMVRLYGLDTKGNYHATKWTLIAKNGVGPYIPVIPTIVLINKLIRGELSTIGAMPCLGMFSLDEFTQIAQRLGIYYKSEDFIG